MAINWLNKDIPATNPEQAAHEAFNIDRFRPGQAELIEATLQGKDVFGIMPTGSGKSLCFQLPALLAPKGRSTIVISPLIALMRDQVARLQELGIPAAAYNSGVDEYERDQILADVRNGLLCLLYTSPEQLGKNDFLDSTVGALFDRIVVDEAHCISQWGHDFRPHYLEIPVFRGRRGITQTSAFTATASQMVGRDIHKHLKFSDPAEYESDPDRPNLKYHVLKTATAKEKQSKLLTLLKEAVKHEGSTIVYCSTRIEVFALQQFLTQNGIKYEPYHGKMGGEERKDAEAKFLSGENKVLIATNAFGMGIDKPDIRLIVHYNIPGNVEAYIQETGRAGRDGEEATCVLLYRPEDLNIQQRFLKAKTPDLGFILMIYRALKRQRDSDKKTRMGGGFFTINRVGLYIAAEKRDDKGKVTKRNTEVNAAIDILINLGVLQSFEGVAKFNEEIDEEGLQELLGQIATVRGDIAKATLGQMVRYAEHEAPSQELLIQLMREDLEQK